MNPQIAPGDRARAWCPLPLVALDAAGNPQAFTATATVDDYATCYVAADTANHRLNVVVKQTPAAGVTKTVTVTIQAADVAGNPLAPVSYAFDVQGPPPPPLATHLQVPLTFGVTSGPLYAPPADPGTATIQLP